MTDSMSNRELIKRVQSSLSKHINKPQLTEKLLNKPPFKFLHDIVTNVSNITEFSTLLEGMYTRLCYVYLGEFSGKAIH